MTQLTIKHLGRRIFYGFKMYDIFTENIMGGINGEVVDYLLSRPTQDFKPILHPLSDLTKPITHKGETFVPLVELYKISVAKIYGYVPEFKIVTIAEEEQTFGLVVKENDSEDRNGFTLNVPCEYAIRFGFDLSIDNERTAISGMSLNQFELFEKLLEWHFVLDEPEGTWVDVNSLPENPYK